MDEGSQRHITQRQRISILNLRSLTRYNLIAYPEAGGSNNIPLFSIAIMEERYPCRPVRVVFDSSHLRRYPGLVPLEIDDSEGSPVAAAPVPYGHAPAAVPAAR